MSISNVGELKSELSAYLFHQRLANRYDNCITLFEPAANARLRVRQQEAQTTLTLSLGGSANLPADYLLWRTVKWIGITPFPPPYTELDYVHPAYMDVSGPSLRGRPNLFTIVGPIINVKPLQTAPATILLYYYQKIPALAGAANQTTNWLLTEYPNAYLYGVLTELAAVQRNADMAQLYKARRDETFAEITQLSALSTGATSPQVRTAEYF